MEYIKHLVECKCILKIFEHIEPPVFHKFVVFSVMEEPSADVIPSFVQCNNCGSIHKVTEVGQSAMLPKEEMRTLESKEDLELELPDKVIAVLKKNDCDLHVWQEAKHILEHEMWGRFVVVSKEKEGSTTLGKALVFHGKSLFKMESSNVKICLSSFWYLRKYL